MNEIDTSWRLRSWVRKRRPMMTTTPSAVIRRPASGRNRARVDASRFGERAASKRSCTGAVHIAATRLRDRLAGIAAAQLNARPEDLFFAGGRVFAAANPENSLSFACVAATDHWSPGGSPEPALRETVFWSPSVLGAPNAADEVNGATVYGFVFDFCGLEIERRWRPY